MHTIKLSLDDQFNEFITDYLDEKLDYTELKVFKEYLEQAEAVRLFVRQVKKGREALSRLPQVKAADDFEEKLARRIALEEEPVFAEED